MSKIFLQISPEAEPSGGCKRKKKLFETFGSATCWKVVEIGGIDNFPMENLGSFSFRKTDERRVDVRRGSYWYAEKINEYKSLKGLSLRLATRQSLLRFVGTKSGRRIYRSRMFIGSAWRREMIQGVLTLHGKHWRYTRSWKRVAPKAKKRTWILGVSARENIAKLENSLVRILHGIALIRENIFPVLDRSLVRI